MYGNLLIKTEVKQTLELFVQMIKSILGCCEWQERNSSNYVGERYFRCFVLGLEMTVAIADDSEFTGYDFWIRIEAPLVANVDKVFLADLADNVARQLTLQGYEVLRPNNIGRVGSGAVSYRLNPITGAKTTGKIITEEV